MQDQLIFNRHKNRIRECSIRFAFLRKRIADLLDLAVPTPLGSYNDIFSDKRKQRYKRMIEFKATFYTLTMVPLMFVFGHIMLTNNTRDPFAWLTITMAIIVSTLFGFGQYIEKRELKKRMQNYDRKLCDLERRLAMVEHHKTSDSNL